MKRALLAGLIAGALAAACLPFETLESTFCTEFPSSPACTDAGPICPSLACDGGCVDADADEENCGGCGNSCGGGSCTSGVCGVAVLATGLSDPRFVRARGGTAYFASAPDQVVYRWASDGGGLSSISGIGFPGARAVALGAIGRIHFASDSPVDGGVIHSYFENTGAVNVVTYGLNIAELEFQGGLLMWTDPVTPTKPLWFINADGTGGQKSYSGPTNAGTQDMAGLSSDGLNVYWAENRSGNGAVRQMLSNGCCNTPLTVADFQSHPTRPFAWGGKAFWVNTVEDGGIGETILPPSSNPIVERVVHQPNPAFLYVDAEGIYWANHGLDAGGGGSSPEPDRWPGSAGTPASSRCSRAA
jgi:hypothetical protein